MADSVDTQTACNIHYLFSDMANAGADDAAIERCASMSIFARDVALAIPARTIADVKAKLQMLIEDAGTGVIEVEHLEFVMADLDDLIGAVQ